MGRAGILGKGEDDAILSIILHLIRFPAVLRHLLLIKCAEGFLGGRSLETGLARRGIANELRARVDRNIAGQSTMRWRGWGCCSGERRESAAGTGPSAAPAKRQQPQREQAI